MLVDGVRKTFGKTHALDGVSFRVETGTVLGLLGPNGAGKTTMIRILATLLEPDEGRAFVGGHDVMKHPGEVRKLIGLTGQYAAVDELLSGRENLRMIGRLLGLKTKQALARADELLEVFDLTEASGRHVKTYSGGMRRRLDLAASLVGRPKLLYLDEPTTGLDPRSRRQLWELIRTLTHDGTTVLLTTQYLEEADELSDRIVVIDHGRVIAEGTSDELKAKVGGQVLEVRPADPDDLERVVDILVRITGSAAAVETSEGMASATIADASDLASAVRRFDRAKIALADIGMHRPSLDNVFLALTGHAAEEQEVEA